MSSVASASCTAAHATGSGASAAFDVVVQTSQTLTKKEHGKYGWWQTFNTPLFICTRCFRNPSSAVRV